MLTAIKSKFTSLASAIGRGASNAGNPDGVSSLTVSETPKSPVASNSGAITDADSVNHHRTLTLSREQIWKCACDFTEKPTKPKHEAPQLSEDTSSGILDEYGPELNQMTMPKAATPEPIDIFDDVGLPPIIEEEEPGMEMTESVSKKVNVEAEVHLQDTEVKEKPKVIGGEGCFVFKDDVRPSVPGVVAAKGTVVLTKIGAYETKGGGKYVGGYSESRDTAFGKGVFYLGPNEDLHNPYYKNVYKLEGRFDCGVLRHGTAVLNDGSSVSGYFDEDGLPIKEQTKIHKPSQRNIEEIKKGIPPNREINNQKRVIRAQMVQKYEGRGLTYIYPEIR